MSNYMEIIGDKLLNFANSIDIVFSNLSENISNYFDKDNDKSDAIKILIFECENNKFYLEGTTDITTTIKTYLKNKNSIFNINWLNINRPKHLYYVIDANDGFDEDKYVIFYMYLFGIENVRGGTFIDDKISSIDSIVINKMHKRYDAKYIKEINFDREFIKKEKIQVSNVTDLLSEPEKIQVVEKIKNYNFVDSSIGELLDLNDVDACNKNSEKIQFDQFKEINDAIFTNSENALHNLNSNESKQNNILELEKEFTEKSEENTIDNPKDELEEDYEHHNIINLDADIISDKDISDNENCSNHSNDLEDYSSTLDMKENNIEASPNATEITSSNKSSIYSSINNNHFDRKTDISNSENSQESTENIIITDNNFVERRTDSRQNINNSSVNTSRRFFYFF